MTGVEYDNFCKLDEKKYILTENDEFKDYYNKKISEGYNPIIRFQDMQNLMKEIVMYFEFKYPEAMLFEVMNKKSTDEQTKICNKISKKLDINQLKYRLPHSYEQFLDCNYGGLVPLMRTKQNIFDIKRISILIDSEGNIRDEDIKCIKEEGFLNDIEGIKTIEDLFLVYKQIDTNVDYSELESHVYFHKTNLEMRNKLLELIPIYMLYSKNTLPEHGYFRAKSFIKMFNKEYNLNLNFEEVDRIMSINYKDISSNDKVYRRKFK